MRLGYDTFYTKPGSVNEMQCRVCDTPCHVKRDVYGPGSWITSMAGQYDYHDVFLCPHSNEAWHEQALQLVLAIEETPSKRVAELMRQDLDDLFTENGVGSENAPR